MDEKGKLLQSMEKLIKNISLSKRHQQEIFKSLRKIDIEKIINNLYDSEVDLRITSITLLSRLFYDDDNIKMQFIDMMNLSKIPGNVASINISQIIINPKVLSLVSQPKLKNIFKEIKKQPIVNNNKKNKINKISLWYINIQQQPVRIQFTDFIKGDNIDPINNIVGLTVNSSTDLSNQNITTNNTSIKNYIQKDINMSNIKQLWNIKTNHTINNSDNCINHNSNNPLSNNYNNTSNDANQLNKHQNKFVFNYILNNKQQSNNEKIQILDHCQLRENQIQVKNKNANINVYRNIVKPQSVQLSIQQSQQSKPRTSQLYIPQAFIQSPLPKYSQRQCNISGHYLNNTFSLGFHELKSCQYTPYSQNSNRMITVNTTDRRSSNAGYYLTKK